MKHLRFWAVAALCFFCIGTVALGAQEVQRVGKGTKIKTAATPTAAPTASPDESVEATDTPVPAQSSQDMGALLSSVGTGIADGEKREDPALVALGSMGASNLYYSYLTIGSVADGFVSGTYQPRVAISVANEAIFMNETSKASLVKLKTTGLIAPEDKEVIEYLISTYDLLNAQAKALVVFISDRNNDGMEYQKYRKEAWSRIVTLFGIK